MILALNFFWILTVGFVAFCFILFFHRDSGWNDPVMMSLLCHALCPGDKGGQVWLSANRRGSPNSKEDSESSSNWFLPKGILRN